METTGTRNQIHLRELPIAVFIIDVDSWCVHETNPAGVQLLGDAPDSIVGTAITEHAGGRADAFADTLEEMAAVDGTSRRRELPDGSPIRVEGDTETGIPVELRGRRLTTRDSDQYAVVMRDISRSVRQSRRLNTLESAVEHAFDAIYVTDETAEIRHVNREFEAITGHTAPEILGANASILEPDNHDGASFADHSDTATDGQAWTEEVINQRASGERFAAKQTHVPVVAPNTGLDGFVVIQKDITEPKLRRQQVDVFHRVLRHNLRNAITVVQGHTEQLLDTVADEKKRRKLQIIERHIQSLLETSEKAQVARDAVLADSDAGTGHDLMGALEGVSKQVVSTYPDAEVDIESGIDEMVRVDSRATTVLRELVENAFEHADTPAPHVSVAVDRGDDEVTVTVTDNGPGIDDGERRALEATTGGPLQHTSGLGLWLVNWIAETLGGGVGIEESGASGTTVSVTLPTIDD